MAFVRAHSFQSDLFFLFSLSLSLFFFFFFLLLLHRHLCLLSNSRAGRHTLCIFRIGGPRLLHVANNATSNGKCIEFRPGLLKRHSRRQKQPRRSTAFYAFANFRRLLRAPTTVIFLCWARVSLSSLPLFLIDEDWAYYI